MSEYAKGKWKATTNVWGAVIVMADNYICRLDGIESPRETREANAHLISAAPEMYEALEAVKDRIEGEWELDADSFQLVLKALAKAEGKDQ